MPSLRDMIEKLSDITEAKPVSNTDELLHCICEKIRNTSTKKLLADYEHAQNLRKNLALNALQEKRVAANKKINTVIGEEVSLLPSLQTLLLLNIIIEKMRITLIEVDNNSGQQTPTSISSNPSVDNTLVMPERSNKWFDELCGLCGLCK